MGRYRKLPVEIEAVRIVEVTDEFVTFDENSTGLDWLLEALSKDIGDVGGLWILNRGLRVGTLEGTMAAQVGDWIVRGVQGEIYPVKNDIFGQTYEPVDE